MKGRRSATIAACAIYIGLAAGHGPLAAQSKPAAIPDLAGWWNGTPAARPLNDGVKVPWVIADLPLNERAKAYQNVFDEAISPKYYCQPATSPAIIADPYHMEIVQQKDRVIIRYEKDDVVRTVWMDGRKPKIQDFSVQGFSVGRYEGNMLVVETTHFVFDVNGFDDLAGLPSSSVKKVTEWYWREGDRLNARIRVEDPLFFRKPVETTTFWPRAAKDYKWLPFNCDPEESSHMIQFMIPKYK